MTSLRQDLEDMKFSGWSQAVYQLKDKEIDAILAVLESHLPPQYVDSEKFPNTNIQHGYNQALTNIKTILNQAKKEDTPNAKA